jgi:hypothetical protein
MRMLLPGIVRSLGRPTGDRIVRVPCRSDGVGSVREVHLPEAPRIVQGVVEKPAEPKPARVVSAPPGAVPYHVERIRVAELSLLFTDEVVEAASNPRDWDDFVRSHEGIVKMLRR